MKLHECIDSLKEEKMQKTDCRFPCRAILLHSREDYQSAMPLLKSLCDRVVSPEELFFGADLMPAYDKVLESTKPGEWVLLSGVSEYLRLYYKSELKSRRLAKLWHSIQPIRELCEATHAHGAWFHTDAVQAVGHIKIDAHALGVDFLSASAHKFNGPKGIGFLYIRKGVELPPYADGGAQESAHRAGTENVAAIAGMAAALKANCDLLEQNQQHILSLERQLISKLDESGIAYKRNGGNRKLPGLLSLSFPGKDGEAILHRMDLMGISISTGSACDSVNTEISHVLQAIRLDEKYAKGTIRISLGKNNTEADAERIAEALIKVIT